MMVYVINLPDRSDRKESVSNKLRYLGLGFNIWVATKNSNGILGLLYTMRDLLTYCLSNYKEPVLILEDDVEFMPEINKLYNAISQLPKNFDGLWLGCKLNDDVEELYSENLIRIKNAYATHAVYYSQSGMRKVLFQIDHLLSNNKFRALDLLIINKVQVDGNCYCTFPLMAGQSKGFSDIEKKEIDYAPFIEELFKKKTEHLKWQ